MYLRGIHQGRRTRRATTAAVATAALFAAVPGTAEAKTFIASFEDPSGDGPSDARDIVSGRVAYNRKSGALSATIEVGADFAEERSDALMVMIVSDLVNGRCRKVSMTMGALISDPAVPVAWKGIGTPKHKYYGTGSLEGSTYKMRVKSKGLAGKTPGCTAFALMSPDDTATVYDDTDISNGFR